MPPASVPRPATGSARTLRLHRLGAAKYLEHTQPAVDRRQLSRPLCRPATPEEITIMKKKPVVLPFVVSVRFPEPEFRQIVTMAQTGRRTISQTVRILIEAALREPQLVS